MCTGDFETDKEAYSRYNVSKSSFKTWKQKVSAFEQAHPHKVLDRGRQQLRLELSSEERAAIENAFKQNARVGADEALKVSTAEAAQQVHALLNQFKAGYGKYVRKFESDEKAAIDEYFKQQRASDAEYCVAEALSAAKATARRAGRMDEDHLTLEQARNRLRLLRGGGDAVRAFTSDENAAVDACFTANTDATADDALEAARDAARKAGRADWAALTHNQAQYRLEHLRRGGDFVRGLTATEVAAIREFLERNPEASTSEVLSAARSAGAADAHVLTRNQILYWMRFERVYRPAWLQSAELFYMLGCVQDEALQQAHGNIRGNAEQATRVACAILEDKGVLAAGTELMHDAAQAGTPPTVVEMLADALRCAKQRQAWVAWRATKRRCRTPVGYTAAHAAGLREYVRKTSVFLPSCFQPEGPEDELPEGWSVAVSVHGEGYGDGQADVSGKWTTHEVAMHGMGTISGKGYGASSLIDGHMEKTTTLMMGIGPAGLSGSYLFEATDFLSSASIRHKVWSVQGWMSALFIEAQRCDFPGALTREFRRRVVVVERQPQEAAGQLPVVDMMAVDEGAAACAAATPGEIEEVIVTAMEGTPEIQSQSGSFCRVDVGMLRALIHAERGAVDKIPLCVMQHEALKNAIDDIRDRYRDSNTSLCAALLMLFDTHAWALGFEEHTREYFDLADLDGQVSHTPSAYFNVLGVGQGHPIAFFWRPFFDMAFSDEMHLCKRLAYLPLADKHYDDALRAHVKSNDELRSQLEALQLQKQQHGGAEGSKQGGAVGGGGGRAMGGGGGGGAKGKGGQTMGKGGSSSSAAGPSTATRAPPPPPSAVEREESAHTMATLMMAAGRTKAAGKLSMHDSGRSPQALATVPKNLAATPPAVAPTSAVASSSIAPQPPPPPPAP